MWIYINHSSVVYFYVMRLGRVSKSKGKNWLVVFVGLVTVFKKIKLQRSSITAAISSIHGSP